MIIITYPVPAFKVKKMQGKDTIFDAFRKRWVPLTPEEWVRQNFLQYLSRVKQYPASLIAVERVIMLGDVKKRFDIVVFKNAVPWMIIECKESEVELSEAVVKQVLNYNVALQVEYLVITNGKSTFGLYIQGGKFEWLTALPDF
jgi:hypothetical protein